MKLYINIYSMVLLAIFSAPTLAVGSPPVPSAYTRYSFPVGAVGSPPVPSAYTIYSFPVGMEKGFSELTFKTTVLTDPGRNAFVYWANNWDGGYTGLQATGFGKKRIFLFSIWDAIEAKEGSAGSSCSLFSHEGSGASCSINYDWVEGYTYRQHLEINNKWATLTVTEENTGKNFVIGSIKLEGDTLPATSMSSWTEYVEWNDNSSVCENQPYASVRFAIPTTDNGEKLKISGVSTGKYCSEYTTVTYDKNESVQRTNIGNSLRGSITGMNNLLMSAKDLTNGSPVLLSNDYGAIIGKEFNLCVDVVGGNTEPGTPVQLYGCNLTPAQQWAHSVITKQLVNKKSNKCLAPAGNENNAKIEISPCNESDLQKWDFIDSMYKNKHTGLCLDVTGGVIAQGTMLQQYTCNYSKAQKFVNIKGAPANQWVLSRDNTIRTKGNYCLAVSGNGIDAGSVVEIQQCSASSKQTWKVSGNTIKHMVSNLCLDVKDAQGVVNTPLQIWHCNNTAAQQWTMPKIIQNGL